MKMLPLSICPRSWKFSARRSQETLSGHNQTPLNSQLLTNKINCQKNVGD